MCCLRGSRAPVCDHTATDPCEFITHQLTGRATYFTTGSIALAVMGGLCEYHLGYLAVHCYTHFGTIVRGGGVEDPWYGQGIECRRDYAAAVSVTTGMLMTG